ncbi:DUF7257 domain-containing protein [Mycobacterium riyadhense]|uniref:DUF7257 domain-containing protein n=1 Tax=Mycobacterium riyadhense TaxID=486698 RepID=UPI00195C3A8F|nr:hypothetical protein [Mycobacterium riyadhense]
MSLLSTILQRLVADAQISAQNTVEDILEQLQSWSTAVTQAANGAADNLAALLDGVLGTGHTIQDLVNHLQQVGSDAATALSQAASALGQIDDMLIAAGQDLAEDFGAAVSGAATNASNALGQIDDIIVGAAQSTAAQVGTVLQSANTNAQGMIDAAVNGINATVGAGNLLAQAQAALASIPTGIFNFFRGPGAAAPVASQAQANAAIEAQVANVVSMQTDILALSAPPVSAGLLNATIDFGVYPDGGMPAEFTVVDWDPFALDPDGDGSASISGGKVVLDPGTVNNGDTFKLFIYNTPTQTDYQEVSEIWTGLVEVDSSAMNYLGGRVNAAGTTGVFWGFGDDTVATPWLLFYTISGVTTVIAEGDSDWRFNPAAKYALRLGTPTGLKNFQILENGIPLKDSLGNTEFVANSSVAGAANRFPAGGVSGRHASPNELPLPVSTFSASDQVIPPGPGVEAHVAAGESTASTSFADLTTADGVTVNIGSSRSALVFLYSQISHPTAGGQGILSFEISGASTLAANDDRSIENQSAAFAPAGRIGAPFMITSSVLTGVGPTTFKPKAKVGAGGGTATFTHRRIAVIPL